MFDDLPIYNPLTVTSRDNHVYFYSPVSDDRCLDLMRVLREVDVNLRTEYTSRNLQDVLEPTPIWLHINSPGGNLFAAFAVADQLSAFASPIYSIVEGVCASAATLISLSCTRRLIQPNAFMLVHQFTSMHWGTYEEFQDEMRMQNMLLDKLVNFYLDKTCVSRKKLHKILKRNYWMNAEEACKLGFADGVVAEWQTRRT